MTDYLYRLHVLYSIHATILTVTSFLLIVMEYLVHVHVYCDYISFANIEVLSQ